MCASTPVSELAVLAGAHLRPLAERLSWQQGAVAVHRQERAVVCRRLWVISDGTDLVELSSVLANIQYDEVVGVVVDAPGAVLVSLLGPDCVREVVSTAQIYEEVLAAFSAAQVPVRSLKRAFLSHAVADEARLQSAVRLVRAAGGELFSCADSIRVGSGWRLEIKRHLAAAEVFVLVASEASKQSTWCAFECGVASALGIPIRIVSLDGGPPPGFFSDRQATDVPRLLVQKPWMSFSDGVCEALLSAVAVET